MMKRIFKTTFPKGYKSSLSILETEVAIKQVKDFFESRLAACLDLYRVSAPLFVEKATGLNDDLNGIERPVGFDCACSCGHLEVVQSLAKWKRMALGRYGIEAGKGLYTDMNAIRRDEVHDNLHSMYVDQWDWEKVIHKDQRTVHTLKEVVAKIYGVFKELEAYVGQHYPSLMDRAVYGTLPEEIFFITAQELEDLYPDLTAKEREDAICKKVRAVFIQGIGAPLASGEPHDGRAPDYDDWALNGDIVFWNPVLGRAFELSSMGIRVDEDALVTQLTQRQALSRLELPFHKALMEKEMPYTMGGGIGQSRICMYFLRKAHIGEVQASTWDQETLTAAEKAGVSLL